MKPTSWNNLGTINHNLAITDAWIELRARGELSHFRYELKERYRHIGKERVYAPDVFFGWNKKAFLMEIQLSALSRAQWKDKLKIAEEYFVHGYFRDASWQTRPDKTIRPRLVILTNQPEATVKQSTLEMHVIQSIAELEGLL
jgi:hypothetical protein